MAGFWQEIARQVKAITETKPDTFDKLTTILGAPFYAGSGGDNQMFDLLIEAGWRITWSEADYHFKAEHPVTGERLEYVEGDLYKIA